MEDCKLYGLNIKPTDVGDGHIEFVAIYDQFPTIIGVGATREEAIAEAEIFLKQYLEYCKDNNIELPAPSTNDWQSDFSGKITVRMPKSLHRDLFDYARKDGMSINSIVNDAIRSYLNCQTLTKMADEITAAINEACLDFGDTISCTPINNYMFPEKNVLN